MNWLADGALLGLWSAAAWGAGALAPPLGWTFAVLGTIVFWTGWTVRGALPSAAALAIALGTLCAHGVALGPLPDTMAWLMSASGACSLAAGVAGLAAIVRVARSSPGAAGTDTASAPPSATVASSSSAPFLARPRLELLIASLGALGVLASIPPALMPLGVDFDLAAVWRPLGGCAVGLAAGLSGYVLLCARPRRTSRLLSSIALIAAAVVALTVDGPRPPVAAPTRVAFPAR